MSTKAEIKLENEFRKTNAYASWIIATIILALASGIPLLFWGNASFYSDLIKYHGINQHTCLGGANLTNPQITPFIYNTSLTYWPAQLHAATFVIHNNNNGNIQYRPVTLSYPTRLEKIFDCEKSKYDNRAPCNKMVGDVIIKYEYLQSQETFTCYIDGDTIIGLSSEVGNIGKKYRYSTAGIVLMVFYAIISIICLSVYCELICYIPEPKYVPWGADLSHTPTLLRESINRTSLSGTERRECTSNWDSAVRQQQLSISNKDIRLESVI